MKHFYIIIILLTVSRLLNAQSSTVPVLEREVSLSISNESVQYILTAVSQQAGFVFSYSPDEIGSSSKTSIEVKNKSVRHVLNTLFNGTVSYKVKGKYVILKKNEIAQGAKSSDEVVVEGYLFDSNTGEKISEATVYSKDQMVSATTDEYGYFKLEVPIAKPETELKISKMGYADTLILPAAEKISYVNIELDSKKISEENLVSVTPQEEEKWEFVFPEWLISDKLLANSRNISDTLFKKFQFSVLPYVSTNKFLTGNTVNDYSLNLTVGYIQGVSKIELGGIANIVREDAGFCQLAGVANVVGGIAYGLQGAGTLNYSKNFSGIQSAGLLNIVLQDASFVQSSGVGNFVGGTFSGVQAAGAINISSKLEGVQLSGAANFAGDAVGVQVTGAINHASKMVGTQVSGLFNNADSLEGVQVTGLLNRASRMKGFQIGLVNVSDTCDGIPFGLLNIVRKGYHKLEFSTDEIFYTNIAFRGGVRKFHTIISTGIIPKNFESPVWTYGWGIGTTFRLSNKLHYDIDLTSQMIMKGDDLSMINSLRKFYMGLDWKIAEKTSMAVGLTYNIYITETNSEFYDLYSNLMPYTIADNNYMVNRNIKTWFGGKIGLRFF